jgi:outer membrane protein OmpA-like peptidoglycan-associated protein
MLFVTSHPVFSFRKVLSMLTFRHLLASLALTVAFAGSASADVSNFNKVVLDKNGSPVGDIRGGCVVANGENTTGACRAATPAPVAKPVAQLPVVKPATPVPSQESRTVYFDFNKSVLLPSGKEKLDSLAKVLSDAHDVQSVDIVGHADRIGTKVYNLKLSEKRAETVKNYLFSKGYKKVNKVNVSAVGSEKPTTSCKIKKRNDLVSCLSSDRRATVELNYVK